MNINLISKMTNIKSDLIVRSYLQLYKRSICYNYKLSNEEVKNVLRNIWEKSI